MTTRHPEHYDVLVVGSGFGGSVTALRLSEKGYRVGVLEAGRRFADEDFAATSWDLPRFLWAPRLGLKGIQRIHLLPDVMVLAGAGVGGGSLNYANTLYRPRSDAFYTDPQWAHITDWKAELAPYYDQAKRMLGVVENPLFTPSDEVMKKTAEEMGVGDTFHPTLRYPTICPPLYSSARNLLTLTCPQQLASSLGFAYWLPPSSLAASKEAQLASYVLPLNITYAY